MNKEQAIQKIENKTFLQEDLLAYYQIKTVEALEFALEEKFKQVTQTGDFLNSAFKYVYDSRKVDQYNPIEEKYIFYAMILQGLYNLDSDEIRIIAAGIGAFKTVMLLDKILGQKEEVVFFEHMYKKYIERIENVYLKLNDILGSLNKFLNDFNPEQLEKFSGELQKALGNLKLDS
jgi:ERCC4-related helicase